MSASSSLPSSSAWPPYAPRPVNRRRTKLPTHGRETQAAHKQLPTERGVPREDGRSGAGATLRVLAGVTSRSRSRGSKEEASSSENTIRPSVVAAAQERPAGEKAVHVVRAAARLLRDADAENRTPGVAAVRGLGFRDGG
eukprot:878065-Rhodomonas_salina.2